MLRTFLRLTLLVNTRCDDIINTSTQIYMCPSSSIQYRIPINDLWCEAYCGTISFEMSISGWYVFGNGIGAWAGSVSPFLESYLSTFLTAAVTYCIDKNAHSLTPFYSTIWRIFPPSNMDGRPIDYSLSSNYCPISFCKIYPDFSEITEKLSTYRSMYSWYFFSSEQVEARIHTLGLSNHDSKPKWFIHLLRWCQKLHPGNFIP